MLKQVLLLTALTLPAAAQTVTRADYDRAAAANEKYRSLVLNLAEKPFWLENESTLVYTRDNRGNRDFVQVDAATGTKSPAFDQVKVAAALTKELGKPFAAGKLPFTQFRYVDKKAAIDFPLEQELWHCDLKTYACESEGQRRHRRHAGPAGEMPWAANSVTDTKPSPDGKWEALVENYNVVVRPVILPVAGAPPAKPPANGVPALDHKADLVLSTDGSEANYYALSSIAWSPDSTRLVAYRIRPGYKRMVHYVESAPAAQLQPLYSEIEYTKPGDVLDLQQPVLFDLAARRGLPVANDLFPNPFDLGEPRWFKDGRGFTFHYNQRGHQVFRVIEVDGKTAVARTLIDETSKTFIDYQDLTNDLNDTGKIYRHDVADGNEIIWMSERDGWAHLFLVDGKSGRFKGTITRGDWVVRSVDYVDDAKRQIYFEASGVKPGEDPYLEHAYRINFDGSGLLPLTEGPGDHLVTFSPDGKYYTDLHSSVSEPPVLELFETAANRKVATLEQGNADELKAAGWHAPEPFVAKGRDGKTDIWGVIWKPANFDPAKHYPVIEDIYAGPQGSFVPKTFSTRTEPLTELGFVVVEMDGMGTNNRSRAFHDVAWQNLKDAGFEDRILWHKAAAAKYPWYDISKVGIFGTSAGGQSALGALLFHPDFYKVAVSNSGCHDNRMDKIWWNEQWMGWPIGPQYSASSNVDNAYRLQGKLLLVVGELDDNVDPASTFQVADRLEKANKTFDLLYVPGGKHGAGGAYGYRKLEDFFVQNIMGTSVPDWNTSDPGQ